MPSDPPGMSADTFRVAEVLQSNMVVQQGRPFRLWGTAPSGSKVRIIASWAEKPMAATAGPEGEWIAAVPVPEAVPGDFSAHTIDIAHENDTVKLENVLIGEVWMCSGQSNMTFMLDSIAGWGPGVPDHDKEVAAADYPYIRLMGVGMALEDRPVSTVRGTWKACGPGTVGSFSAVAYYFGRELFKELNVPVGLVANGIPGAGGQAFTSREVLKSDTALQRKYLQPYKNKPRNDKEHILATLQRPALIYNGMIYPIQNLSIRGFIWYQGESNRSDGELYTRLSASMLQGWRKDFNQGDLPFYFVQMPPYGWKEGPGASSYARFREAQEAILKVKNTGMAVAMDVGDPDDLHPRNKKPVGLRLAKLALNKTYGLEDIPCQGPEFSGFTVDNDIVKASFKNADKGLRTNDDRDPECFYLAGADSVFHKAEASIHGNEVWLHSKKVSGPVAVRYAFTNRALTNLCNSEGLSAEPFRTDDWDNALTLSADSPAVHPATKSAPAPVFNLAPVLQSNMVIQQNKPFRLWGTAPAGDTVKMLAGWSGQTIAVAADEEGSWKGQIDVPEAVPGDFEPYSIRVIHDSGEAYKTDTLRLSGILIGDVWLCAGQSNMDMMVGKVEGWYPGVLNYEAEIAGADYPAIRLIKIGADFKLEPQTVTAGGTWQVCSPKTAGGFSAVAYFFGRKLFRELNIPVGLVVTAAPGASCQAFTPREVLESTPLLKEKYLEPYAADLASQQKVDSASFFTKVTRPTLIYNAMIHPLENLSLKGFSWYQGESNHTEREEYTKLCTAMINSWRKRFGQSELPFYFTQIAPYKTEFDKTGAVSAFFREAQENLLEVKNTGMAVTMDVGEYENVHPRDKKSVGERLAASALSGTYGKSIVHQGPVYAGMKIKRDKVRLSFVPSSLGSGLETRNGEAPKHFYLAGEDQVFHPAKARIKGNHVWLSSVEVADPVAVRYAFSNGAITNLRNREGFPALPFRTDNWNKQTAR